MKLIILRGLPGSGKTTLVRKEWPNAAVCSADSYFYGPKAMTSARAT
jgi:predicted kinase